MPIYEYACGRCGHLVEVMQRVSDPAPAACPSCSAPELTRQVSRTTFQLKGGGWYADLYGSTKKPATAETAKPAGDAAKPAGETAGPATSAAAAKKASDA